MVRNVTIFNLILVLSTVLIIGTESKTKTIENDRQSFPQGKTNIKGVGISAWGLVFLIVSLILLGVAAYYIAFFYPILCKKERKYNRIELTTV